jgi:uncharacterized membrane protein
MDFFPLAFIAITKRSETDNRGEQREAKGKTQEREIETDWRIERQSRKLNALACSGIIPIGLTRPIETKREFESGVRGSVRQIEKTA